MTKANLITVSDAKPRVLASSEKPRTTPEGPKTAGLPTASTSIENSKGERDETPEFADHRIRISYRAGAFRAQQPLYGEMDLEFNLGWLGPSLTIPEWTGTVTIDGIPYGMAFFSTDSG